MKCEHCGNNLRLEDKFCPYCGRTNLLAQQHQREMQHFSREFTKTRTDVLEQSSRFNRRTVRITILSILVALCAVMAFLCVKADDIRWWRMERQIEAKADIHMAELDRLIEDRDFIGVYAYYNGNHLSYGYSSSSPLRNYEAVYYVSMYYKRFYEDLMTLMVIKKNEEIYKYYSKDGLIEEMAGGLHSLYEEMEPQEYHPEQWAEDKIAYMEDMDETIQQLTVRYFGISEEEAAGMRTMSEARMSVMLEEAYENR